MENLNFRVQYFRDTQSITEIHKNIVSQIFGAIRYVPLKHSNVYAKVLT